MLIKYSSMVILNVVVLVVFLHPAIFTSAFQGLQVFLNPDSPESRFFRVQVFQVLGPGSEYRF